MQDPQAADANTLARETRKKLEMMVLLLATRTAIAGNALLVQAWVPSGLSSNALRASNMPYAAIGSGDALSMLHYASAGHVLELTAANNCPIPQAYSSRKGFYHTDLSQLASVTRCPQTLDAITCTARTTFVMPVWDNSTSYVQGLQPLAVIEFLSTAPGLPHVILQQHAAVAAEQAGAWARVPLHPWPMPLVSDAHAVITIQSKPAGSLVHQEEVDTINAPKEAAAQEQRHGQGQEEGRSIPQATHQEQRPQQQQKQPPAHSLVAVSLPEISLRPRITTADVAEPPVHGPSADEELIISEHGHEEIDEEEGGGTPYGAAGITSADLRAQFDVGLQDAAKNLGVSVTTIKRACRRHGISRWPRRDLKRLQQALASMEASGASVTGAVSTIISPGATPHAPQSLEVGRKRSGGAATPTSVKRKTTMTTRRASLLGNNHHHQYLETSTGRESPGGSNIENALYEDKRAPLSASPLGSSAFGAWAPTENKEGSTPAGVRSPPPATDLSVPEMSALQALYAMQSLATPAPARRARSPPEGNHGFDGAIT